MGNIDFVDGYTSRGDNWAIYNCPINNTWQFLEKDFEYTMFDPFHNAYDAVTGNPKSVLAYRLLQVEQYHNIPLLSIFSIFDFRFRIFASFLTSLI